MDKFLLRELGTGELGGDMQTTTIDTHLQVRRSSPKQKHQHPKQTRRLQPLHPLQRLQPLQPLQLLQLQAARLRWAVRYRYAQDGILPCEAVATVMPLTLVSGWAAKDLPKEPKEPKLLTLLAAGAWEPFEPLRRMSWSFFFRCLIVWYPWYPKNRSF